MSELKSKIHIIAEAGTNNNGKIQKAKNLAKIAFDAGADSVKFQIINTWGLYLPGNYEYGKYKIEDVIKIRQEGEMTDEEYFDLFNYCQEIGIPLSSSIFDEKGLDLLLKFNPPYIKLASCDINNVKLLNTVAEKGVKVVVSTGMADIEEIEIGVNSLSKLKSEDIVILHCVSNYPAYLEQSNLRYLEVLKNRFQTSIGFSDHTGNSIAACMAMTLGATWFEKHFTEDKNQIGLDHIYAMEPEQLKQYVQDLRNAEIALKLKEIKIGEAEKLTKQRAKRSLYAARTLKAGEIISEQDVLCVRPENIMPAHHYFDIIGKKLIVDIDQYGPFSPNYFEQ